MRGARLAEMIAAAHIAPAQAQGDAAEPGGKGRARSTRRSSAARSSRTRGKVEFRLMYDFKIDAADKATMYRDLASALEGLVAGEPDADRQHGQCRGADLGDPARPQLGRLLPQRRRRAGARAVPGPPGVHPHHVRRGRVRRRPPQTRQVQRVDDVHAFPGHIACDSASNSEIVVPIDPRRRAARRARHRQPEDGAVRPKRMRRAA